MPESWNTRVSRWGFGWFPAYRSTGARIDSIAADWREIRIRLPLTWRTRNCVGTMFGGGMYAAIDPHMDDGRIVELCPNGSSRGRASGELDSSPEEVPA